MLGVEGEPFLRMDPAGVEANVRSSTWRRSARTSAAHRAVDRASSSNPAWERVAAVPRFGWIEPRAAIPEPSDRADRSAAAMGSSAQWEVPMQLGDEPLRVEGVVEWKAATVAASASSARD